MLEEAREDSAGAEGVGFEGDQDEDGRRERVAGSLEVGIELGDERAREIHGSLGQRRVVGERIRWGHGWCWFSEVVVFLVY